MYLLLMQNPSIQVSVPPCLGRYEIWADCREQLPLLHFHVCSLYWLLRYTRYYRKTQTFQADLKLVSGENCNTGTVWLIYFAYVQFVPTPSHAYAVVDIGMVWVSLVVTVWVRPGYGMGWFGMFPIRSGTPVMVTRTIWNYLRQRVLWEIYCIGTLGVRSGKVRIENCESFCGTCLGPTGLCTEGNVSFFCCRWKIYSCLVWRYLFKSFSISLLCLFIFSVRYIRQWIFKFSVDIKFLLVVLVILSILIGCKWEYKIHVR